MRLLVAGYGYTGRALGRCAVAAGHEVFAISRSADFEPDIRGLPLDLLSGDLHARLPAQVDAIAYLVSPQGGSEGAYRAAYIDALKRLLHHYRTGSPRWLLASSTAVYGEAPPAPDGFAGWVNEDTPPAPLGINGRVLLEAESLIHTETSGGICLRLGGIYGAGRSSLMERVLSGALSSRQAGPRMTQRIHQEDAARAALHLLTRPTPEPVYLGVDSAPTPLRDVVRFIEAELAARTSALVPRPRTVSERGGSPRAGTRHVADKRCSNQRLLSTGFALQYPSYREGYRALLAER